MSLITVTTSIGCGATAVSRKVADDLKIDLYDDERLQQEALNMGYSSQDLKGFDEKAPGLFDRRSFTKWPIEMKVSLSATGPLIF
jgi:cytidylate kinase